MTVEVQDPFNTYTAAPGATVFPYTFKIVSAADLIATIDDIVVDLGIDYSLSGVGSNDGGDLTLLVPLTGGQEVLLKRQMTFERETDYQQNGDFNAPVVNNDFDRLWLALQQLGQDLLRSIKVPFTETTDQTISASPAARANKALIFDAAGNIAASIDDYNDQAANAAASAAAAAASLNAVNVIAEEVEADRVAAGISADAAAASAASINPANLIHTTGNESKTGVLTFVNSPVVPTATNLNEAVNKGQLDVAIASSVALRGYIAGLILSTAGASSTFAVSAGVATNSTAAALMNLSASMTKTTSDFAAGNANGALDTGAIANNTAYSAFLIRNPTSSAVDILVSLSATAPTMPSGFTQFRRIGSMITNGSAQWRKFIQRADDFDFDSPTLDVNINNEPSSAVLRTLPLPSGVKVKAKLSVEQNGTGVAVYCYISDPDTADLPPSNSSAPLFSIGSSTNSTYGQQVECFTNTSAQVRTRHSSGSATNAFRIVARGWTDTRGRFD